MEHSEYREEIQHGDHPLSYDHAEPGYRQIAIFMGATVFFLIVIGIGIQMYYEISFQQEEYARVLSQQNWALRDLRQKEQWELTHYGYVDQSKGIVRIPVEQAMKLVAADAASNNPRYPSTPYKIKTAEELAAAGATPGAAPGAAGAAAAGAAPTDSSKSSPNGQPPAPPHK